MKESKPNKKVNIVEIDLLAIKDAENHKGSESVRYSCLSQGQTSFSNTFPIMINTFDISLGLQNIKKGDRFFVKGQLNHYRPKNKRYDFYSINITSMELKNDGNSAEEN
jgi:hypothetical protein